MEIKNITGEELGALLFTIHNHDQETEEIIYRETDLLKILSAIGLPEPQWGGTMTVEEFINKK